MKQLTQAIFDGAPDWVKSAGVDIDGSVYWNSESSNYIRELVKKEILIAESVDVEQAGHGFYYDVFSDSIPLIDREVAK